MFSQMMRSEVSVLSLSPCKAAEKVPVAGPVRCLHPPVQDLLDVWKMATSATGSTIQL